MDIKIIQQLADLMEDKNLSNLEIEENDCKIKLARGTTATVTVAESAPVITQQVQACAAPAPQPEASSNAAASGEELSSPIVGIGYKSPSPGAAPFVSVGSAVKKGQTLCIIEAMKVMNEFTAPRDGVITDVCFEDGQLVEFNQCLFRLG